jgi:hypothetical protein
MKLKLKSKAKHMLKLGSLIDEPHINYIPWNQLHLLDMD